jgi:hypothetical protein
MDGLTVDGTGAEVISVNSTANGSQIAFDSATSSSDWSVGIANDATDDFLIYQAGAGTGDIRLYTDGTERLTVLNGGNVGIGTSSPASATKLNIKQSAVSDINGLNGIRIDHSTGTAYSGFGLNNDNTVITAGDAGGSANTNLLFKTASSGVEAEKLRIDSSGKVGIGTTSPSSALHVSGTDSVSGRLEVTRSGVGMYVGSTGAAGYIQTPSAHPLLFYTNATERMQIDSSGNLLVGTTSSPDGTSAYGSGFVAENNSRKVLRLATSSTAQLSVSRFYNPNGQVGEIKTDGTSTLYVTSSDYRLKENVVTDWDATTRLKQLRPSRFNFIVDPDTTVDGFLAHEVQDIVPEAISGVKDEMQEEEYEVTPAVIDDDGNVVTEAVMGTREVPKYQGIDQAKLVPLLTKAIQEQQALIESLEARITALES